MLLYTAVYLAWGSRTPLWLSPRASLLKSWETGSAQLRELMDLPTTFQIRTGTTSRSRAGTFNLEMPLCFLAKRYFIYVVIFCSYCYIVVIVVDVINNDVVIYNRWLLPGGILMKWLLKSYNVNQVHRGPGNKWSSARRDAMFLAWLVTPNARKVRRWIC